MARYVTITGAIFAVSLDPVLGGNEDLVRYAITQGGLVVVVLVLLWSQRKDTLAQRENRNHQLTALTTLIMESTATLQKHADGIDRMARSIERCSTPHPRNRND